MSKLKELLIETIERLPRPDRIAFGDLTYAAIKSFSRIPEPQDIPAIIILGVPVEVDSSIPPGEIRFKQFVEEDGKISLKVMKVVNVELPS